MGVDHYDVGFQAGNMNLLFNIQEETAPDIPGLTYIPDFITQGEENALIAAIDMQPWLSDLKRRVQH